MPMYFEQQLPETYFQRTQSNLEYNKSHLTQKYFRYTIQYSLQAYIHYTQILDERHFRFT